jgi:hypothetical protein
MDISENRSFFMDMGYTCCQLSKDREYLLKVKWSLAERFPRGDMIRGLTGKLQEPVWSVVVKIFELTSNIQQVWMIQSAKLLSDYPC